MVHRVEGLRVVEDADLDDLARLEIPVDIHVFPAGVGLAEDPGDLRAGREPVHHRHGVVPLHRRDVERVDLHHHHHGDRQVLHPDGQFQFFIDGFVEVLAIGVDVALHIGVIAQGFEGG